MQQVVEYLFVRLQDKYEKMKENVRNVSEKSDVKTENMRLNGIKSKS